MKISDFKQLTEDERVLILSFMGFNRVSSWWQFIAGNIRVEYDPEYSELWIDFDITDEDITPFKLPGNLSIENLLPALALLQGKSEAFKRGDSVVFEGKDYTINYCMGSMVSIGDQLVPIRDVHAKL